MSFTVSLSELAGEPVTVNFSTANGTATAPGDYTEKNGTLTIPTGQASGTITVSIVSDTVAESNDNFQIDLTNPTNALVDDGQGIGTIMNDDAGPNLSINDVTIAEGNEGGAYAIFTITLSAPSTQTVSVNVIPYNGSAVSPADYNSGGNVSSLHPAR